MNGQTIKYGLLLVATAIAHLWFVGEGGKEILIAMGERFGQELSFTTLGGVWIGFVTSYAYFGFRLLTSLGNEKRRRAR